LSSFSHRRDRFHKKPRVDLSDLAQLAADGLTDHLACLSGCYFGMVAQTLVETGDEKQAAKVVKLLAKLFPHLYVEIQHHTTDDTNEVSDDELVDVLYSISVESGVRPIITQDAHYCDLAHKPHHDLMKRVGYYGSASDADEKDWTFPGDGYHLAREEWVHDHYDMHEHVWDAAMDSYTELLDLNKLTIPVLDKYSYHIPRIVSAPDRAIANRCWTTLGVMGLDNKKAYVDRLTYELDVIGQLGFASYFVLVSRIVDHCKDNGIRVSARGSASGSMVCWLLGITQLDPIKWRLMFERFLSLDRLRPPDIDLDIDKFRREEMIEWIGSQYTVVPIGTYGTLGQDEHTGKGSMFVLWMQRERNRLGKEKFAAKYGNVKGMADLPQGVQSKLYALADHGVYKHYGTHAAGLVVTTDEYPIDDLVPTMLVASTGKTVTQMTMDDVEDLGFVKIDFLGLRGEFTVARTLELLGKSPVDEMSWIPLNDTKTFAAVRAGNTRTGIFTFEGYTQAKGAREVRVKSIEDMILVNALYRPATMHGGLVKEYLARKRGDAFTYDNHLFEQAFKDTYGIPVYQEQVLTLLRLLGFPQDELNAMLKAIKASNNKTVGAVQTFDATEDRFIDLCIKAGLTDDQATSAWESIKQFSDYSFNRGHAAEYAIRGYWMAYLKVHHPLEFHAALLEGVSMAGDSDAERDYAREARRCGVKLLAADVSVSNSYWTIDTRYQAVRRGLTSIKGIGGSVADSIVAARPFGSVEEMIEKSKVITGRMMSGGKDYIDTGNFSGALAALRDAGALSSLGH